MKHSDNVKPETSSPDTSSVYHDAYRDGFQTAKHMITEIVKSISKEIDHCTDDLIIYPDELLRRIKKL